MNDFAIPQLSDRRSVKPFTRILNTPPGWPWDQVRIATLEARHTPPLPLEPAPSAPFGNPPPPPPLREVPVLTVIVMPN